MCNKIKLYILFILQLLCILILCTYLKLCVVSYSIKNIYLTDISKQMTQSSIHASYDLKRGLGNGFKVYILILKASKYKNTKLFS